MSQQTVSPCDFTAEYEGLQLPDMGESSRFRLRVAGKSSEALLEQLLGEASWLVSHAEALADYGRKEEATAELLRAASCEEQVACVLEVAEREQEAVVHRE